jgi:hypothetical protein
VAGGSPRTEAHQSLVQIIEAAGKSLGYKFSKAGVSRIYAFLQAMWDGRQFHIPGEEALEASPTQLVALIRAYLLQFHGFEPVERFDPPLRPQREDTNDF